MSLGSFLGGSAGRDIHDSPPQGFVGWFRNMGVCVSIRRIGPYPKAPPGLGKVLAGESTDLDHGLTGARRPVIERP